MSKDLGGGGGGMCCVLGLLAFLIKAKCCSQHEIDIEIPTTFTWLFEVYRTSIIVHTLTRCSKLNWNPSEAENKHPNGFQPCHSDVIHVVVENLANGQEVT